MQTGKGRQWGAAVFREEEGEEASGSTVLEAGDTSKSDAVPGEAEGSG
jgi:hypothetical protein